jgi:hypothetical protein
MTGRTGRADRQLRQAVAFQLVLLAAQYVLGEVLASDVSLPAHHPGTGPGPLARQLERGVLWSLGHSPALLASHAGIGAGLFVVSVVVLVRCRHTGRPGAWTLAGVALVAILVAGVAGAAFVDHHRPDASTTVMALAFGVATACYVGILAWRPRPQR